MKLDSNPRLCISKAHAQPTMPHLSFVNNDPPSLSTYLKPGPSVSQLLIWTIIIPILKMKKLRPREVKKLTVDPSAGKSDSVVVSCKVHPFMSL